jgi:hypothetical protein
MGGKQQDGSLSCEDGTGTGTFVGYSAEQGILYATYDMCVCVCVDGSNDDIILLW